MRCAIASMSLLLLAIPLRAAEPSPVAELLKRDILAPGQTLKELQAYVDAKIPRLKLAASAEEWTNEAARIRRAVLEKVVFRGEAVKWRDAKTQVEWLDTIEGGPGYRIKKLRYEVLPNFWIPALLYEPENLTGKVPVSLAVNGHEAKGKAVDYKQIRCINMAKRGMIVLNVEWLGMGQLRGPGYAHGCMNQLDLCGSSGVAPFYLSMSRGLDILLAHPNADPKRVVVSGLSGGGWQTIFISSLDTRVTLTNPVAGYSSFRTRIERFKDLGDSEQTPCDLATVADYAHLTAMMAPRPTLLTYNSKDNCCFESGYALPPLYDGALPYFKLYGKEKALRTHVNDDPGDHNFGKDNRQALYRMLGDFFFEDDKNYSAEEIACEKEIKTAEQLNVPLPADNLDFNKLARLLAARLPREPERPREDTRLRDWQEARRKSLRELLGPHMRGELRRPPPTTIDAKGDWRAGHQSEEFTDGWTIPGTLLTRKDARGREPVVQLIHDGGRKAAAGKAEALLLSGPDVRVRVLDLFYFGESRPQPKDWLWALMLNTVGVRPLGLQVEQQARMADLESKNFTDGKGIAIVADGPRSCTIVLLAAALEPKAVARVELVDPLGSLKQVIEENRTVDKSPELFCFGLLERFDIKDIAALVAPRPIKIEKASERAAKEFEGLKEWYEKMGGTLEIVPAK
jgi:hypothetical protein